MQPWMENVLLESICRIDGAVLRMGTVGRNSVGCLRKRAFLLQNDHNSLFAVMHDEFMTGLTTTYRVDNCWHCGIQCVRELEL